MNELWEQLSRNLSEEVSRQVMRQVSALLTSELKKGIKFSYTEAEAAEILNMDVQTLARKRKDGEIDYAQTISPPRGKSHGGRFVYMPNHIVDYLVRNERRNGKQEVTFKDVFGGRVVDISGYKKAA